MKKIVPQLGEEFVLSANINDFEEVTRKYVKKYLEFVPEWTVKKGQ